MSNYTQITDFSAKDSLSSGDAEKIILGADYDAEFAAIAAAIGTKADTSAVPALSYGIYKYKTSDTSRSSTITKTADPDLTGMTLTAGGIYQLTGVLVVGTNGSTANGISGTISPVGGTFTAVHGLVNGNLEGGEFDLYSGGTFSTGFGTVFPWRLFTVDALIRNNTATSVELLWAQATSSATATKLAAGSFLTLRRVG